MCCSRYPRAGTQGTKFCGLNVSHRMHHCNMHQFIISPRVIDQHVDLALIAATCITLPTTAATTPFIPFEQTDGLPPHLDTHMHYLPQVAVTSPCQSLPPPTLHFTQIPSARTSTLWNAGVSTVATSTPAPVAATPPRVKRSVHASPMPLLTISQHQIVSPLRSLEFEHELVAHPEKGFVSKLITSVKNGCNIRYQQHLQFPYTARHLPTAHLKAPIIKRFLVKEFLVGNMAEPYTQPPLLNLRCSGLGVVPTRRTGVGGSSATSQYPKAGTSMNL